MSAIGDYSKACFEASQALGNFDRAWSNFQRDPRQAPALETARDEALRALQRLQGQVVQLTEDALSGEPDSVILPFPARTA